MEVKFNWSLATKHVHKHANLFLLHINFFTGLNILEGVNDEPLEEIKGLDDIGFSRGVRPKDDGTLKEADSGIDHRHQDILREGGVFPQRCAYHGERDGPLEGKVIIC